MWWFLQWVVLVKTVWGEEIMQQKVLEHAGNSNRHGDGRTARQRACYFAQKAACSWYNPRYRKYYALHYEACIFIKVILQPTCERAAGFNNLTATMGIWGAKAVICSFLIQLLILVADSLMSLKIFAFADQRLKGSIWVAVGEKSPWWSRVNKLRESECWSQLE